MTLAAAQLTRALACLEPADRRDYLKTAGPHRRAALARMGIRSQRPR